MSERLYYSDPYLKEFEAQVVEVRDVAGRPGIVLDRTAFYPTSGGQPFDTGTIGDRLVVDVIDDGSAVVHVLEAGTAAGTVIGHIDWARRFEHMQQHTGQHVLSAAIDRVSGVRTESFHLGTVSSTIDLARELTLAEIAAAEDLANSVIWEDRPVQIKFVEAEAAAALQLRKESARTGTLRIIEIDGFDVSACGGTHVSRTGAIGIITIAGWERLRGGTRLEFHCGVRALRAQRQLRDTVAASTRLLSTSADDLSRGIERVQDDSRELRRRLKDYESRFAGYEAEAMAARAVDTGAFRAVAEAVSDADLNAIKIMAQAIAARPGHAAVLLTSSSPVSVVVARAADVSLDAAGVLKQLIARFGGKGGGRPELAQGGGLVAGIDEILTLAKQLLSGS